jgi:AcrR family transcriptional regulator
MTAASPKSDLSSSVARGKLIRAALQVFAEKGYGAASTRDICRLAGSNISAIRYYFGSKAGLYRAAFTEPLGEVPPCNDCFDRGLPLDQALRAFFIEFLGPLKLGEDLRLVMKLHFREMIEPTGAWEHEIEAEIKPQHESLARMLTQSFGLRRANADVHRLAFSIIGMGVNFYVGQDIVARIAPQLLATATAIDRLAERLAGYAAAMIAAESARRKRKSGDANEPSSNGAVDAPSPLAPSAAQP